MSRILVLSPEPVRDRMAGMGIRASEIARHLARSGHAATLLTPGDPGEAPGSLREAGVAIGRLTAGDLGAAAGRHDGAVVSGHVSNDLFRSAPPLPTLVDLYDPFLVENLAYASRLGPDVYRHDHATLSLQLARGDRFLVSSPLQRAFYAGFLLALGRVNPALHADDPALERLLAVAPFGVPTDPPKSGTARLRTPESGIGPDDPVLFFGGVYDWYDPAGLLDVYGRVLESVPACRLVFVASPNPGTTPQSAYARAEETAKARGWWGRSVLFVPWFPYEERGSVYLEATASVLTHRPGLETDLSLRTRGLDFLWAGLPVVSHRGGSMGQLLSETGAGLLVDPDDADALAAALVSVLTDGGLRASLREKARAAARGFTWERTLAPVLDFASRPAFDPHKEAFAPAPVAPPTPATLRGRLEALLPGRRGR